MATYSCTRKLVVGHLLIIACGVIFNFYYKTNFQVRAVNLGGWLVTEGWMKPNLFDGIPNNDFLDGTGVRFKSLTAGKYLSAESGGGTIIVANKNDASNSETFKIWRINSTSFNLRVFNKEFVGVDGTANVVAVENKPGFSETFEIVRNSGNSSLVRIKSTNGFFLQVKTEEAVRADNEGKGGWGDDDPSVFILSFTKTMFNFKGEFQITNGYGPILAPQVMREHWETFIVEKDFKFMASNGLNAVRIPVGWWIASNPPPKPYVGGSLHFLDNAFLWAEKYGLKVIICLHAAPGSQNIFDHSGGRDGTIEWGTHNSIQQTVEVIDFLTARYVESSSLYAVELLNEPLEPYVTLNNLTTYYEAAYNAIRKHSSHVYVIMCNRVGNTTDPLELLPFASGLKKSVIDFHYYNLNYPFYKQMTVKQNLDYVYTNRSTQLNTLTKANGPLILVGEWVAEWEFRGATKEDYQKFANAQLQVFRRATFGWAYWSLKNVNNHWSMEWMIKNGYIKL